MRIAQLVHTAATDIDQILIILRQQSWSFTSMNSPWHYNHQRSPQRQFDSLTDIWSRRFCFELRLEGPQYWVLILQQWLKGQWICHSSASLTSKVAIQSSDLRLQSFQWLSKSNQGVFICNDFVPLKVWRTRPASWQSFAMQSSSISPIMFWFAMVSWNVTPIMK